MTLTPVAKGLAVELSLPDLHDFSLSWLGFKHPTFRIFQLLPVASGIMVLPVGIMVVVTLTSWRRSRAGVGVCLLHRSVSQQSPSRLARFSCNLFPMTLKVPLVGIGFAPNNCVHTFELLIQFY